MNCRSGECRKFNGISEHANFIDNRQLFSAQNPYTFASHFVVRTWKADAWTKRSLNWFFCSLCVDAHIGLHGRGWRKIECHAWQYKFRQNISMLKITNFSVFIRRACLCRNYRSIFDSTILTQDSSCNVIAIFMSFDFYSVFVECQPKFVAILLIAATICKQLANAGMMRTINWVSREFNTFKCQFIFNSTQIV